jgi:hypothetical protein
VQSHFLAQLPLRPFSDAGATQHALTALGELNVEIFGGNISPFLNRGCPSRSAATNGRAVVKSSPAARGRL